MRGWFVRVDLGLRASLVLLALSVGGGCDPDPPPTYPMPDADPYTRVVEIAPNRKIDVVFVVDDSPGMAGKQAALASAMPTFVDALTALPGGLPNLHIGVITTDMGTTASGTPTPAASIGTGRGSCAGAGKNGVLQIGAATVADVDDNYVATDVANYRGDLAGVLGKLVRVGDDGCEFEQPLHAMRVGLENTVENAGFLRDDATLAIVMFADEDDCSVLNPSFFSPATATLGPLTSFRCTRFGVVCDTGGTNPTEMNELGVKEDCKAAPQSQYLDDVKTYRRYLLDKKGIARRIALVDRIAGTETMTVEDRFDPDSGSTVRAAAHTCAFTGASGPELVDPQVRLSSFGQLLDRTLFTSNCNGPIDDLKIEGQTTARLIGSPCLPEVIDVQPDVAGVQVDCHLEDVVGDTATATVTPIPPCTEATPTSTCWRVVENQACTIGAQHLQLDVVRVGPPPDPTTFANLYCRRY